MELNLRLLKASCAQNLITNILPSITASSSKALGGGRQSDASYCNCENSTILVLLYKTVLYCENSTVLVN